MKIIDWIIEHNRKGMAKIYNENRADWNRSNGKCWKCKHWDGSIMWRKTPSMALPHSSCLLMPDAIPKQRNDTCSKFDEIGDIGYWDERWHNLVSNI